MRGPLPLHRPGASMFDGKRASLPQNTPGPRNVVPARFPVGTAAQNGNQVCLRVNFI
jgi:hypothetical protein